MKRGGFSIIEALASIAIFAIIMTIAGQLLCALDRSVAAAPSSAAWAAMAMLSIAEDVREARLVTVARDALTILRPGRPPVVWHSRGSTLVREVGGRRDRLLHVSATFALASGSAVVVHFATGQQVLICPRLGRVAQRGEAG